MKVFTEAFSKTSHIICFSVKANSNLAVLQLMAQMGTGADIVSGGELFRALKAGIPPERIVFSGVGKRADEIRYALETGILMLNVESADELDNLNKIAVEMGTKAPIALRINPDIDPRTHSYISTGLKKNKFGIPVTEALALYRKASGMEGIRIVGIDFHIGSQLTTSEPFGEAARRLMVLVEKLGTDDIPIRYIDVGGGLGIIYDKESPPLPESYAKTIMDAIGATDKTLILEPGRVIVGNAGILVTRVLYGKKGPVKNRRRRHERSNKTQPVRGIPGDRAREEIRKRGRGRRCRRPDL